MNFINNIKKENHQTMNMFDKIIELNEADEQEKIDQLNTQSVDLQLKAIDEQIDLLNKKKQELLTQKKGL